MLSLQYMKKVELVNIKVTTDSYPVATYLFLFALEYRKAINFFLPLMHRELIKSTHKPQRGQEKQLGTTLRGHVAATT